MRTLLSVPENLVDVFHRLKPSLNESAFVTCDPPMSRLGSGGGTVHLLQEAMRSEGSDDMDRWISREKRLLLHAGGHGRRIPAYATSGKVLTPIPVSRHDRGQDFSQDLLDLQLPLLERIMAHAPQHMHTLIASGDVLITSKSFQFQDIPQDADVVCYGLWTEPQTASHHGVFLMDRKTPDALDFMLQKPSVEELERWNISHCCMMDIGIWILSDRAVRILSEKCRNSSGELTYYDLYSEFGPALGTSPRLKDDEINRLKVAIHLLPGGHFYHFGTSHELVDSLLRIQTRSNRPDMAMGLRSKPHPSIFKQNCVCLSPLGSQNHEIWIENSHIPASWSLTRKHILTGIPGNKWSVSLPEGFCIDILPMKQGGWALRPYGYDDIFSGGASDPATRFLQRPLLDWLSQRGLSAAQVSTETGDIQKMKLFPLCEDLSDLESMLHFFMDESVEKPLVKSYFRHERFSADDLLDQADLGKLFENRRKLMISSLKAVEKNYQNSIFYQLDLSSLTVLYKEGHLAPPARIPESAPALWRMRNAMMRARCKMTGGIEKPHEYQEAFDILRDSILNRIIDERIQPLMDVKPDQIVWARSPVRIDLAGGWSDTPPYSLYDGGTVVNMAIELNGQPPIQVYIKPTQRLNIVLRSIDLGEMEVIRTFKELSDFRKVGNAFSIPKAALTLAGFSPMLDSKGHSSLESLLRDFGCGLEINLFCAVPAGSGLGTSSILAATVLGALSDFCRLGWTKQDICDRTLILEQLLTTGGGWQDQYGGVLHGVKLLETQPSFTQIPLTSWLPDHLFLNPEFRSLHLLYYTGTTRVAKTILSEIVTGMFLNSSRHLSLLSQMKQHALEMAKAIQGNDFLYYGNLVGQTGKQNQLLDEGTITPQVQAIIDRVNPFCLGLKLPGAGGGGYLYMVAKDFEAASRIKQVLMDAPPNPRARFVDMRLSDKGFQVSRN